MYHGNAEGIDEHMINVHYYYCCYVHSYCSVRSPFLFFFYLFFFKCSLVTVVLDFLLLFESLAKIQVISESGRVDCVQVEFTQLLWSVFFPSGLHLMASSQSLL